MIPRGQGVFLPGCRTTQLDSSIKQLLKSREAHALRLSIYGHLVVLLGFGALAAGTAQNSFEILTTIIVCLVCGLILLLILLFVRKEQWITQCGLSIATMDALAVATLPFIWYAAAGGEVIPRAYFVKSMSLPVVSLAVMIANAVALRPVFITVITIQTCVTHALLLWHALSDPRTVTGVSWEATSLGPIVNVPFYLTVIVQIAMAGALLILITARARRIIVGAIEMERLNGHIGRYFSPNVREEIASAGVDFFTPGGKEQEVVVLFSDIRGFTALSETLGARGIVRLLSDYQKIMLDVIFTHEGTLDKFIGDAILATFGTPTTAPDDADRAVACAREMMLALDQWNRTRRQAGEPEIRTGIGIHAGPAIVGNIGSEDRLEYTVIGDTVNTASRVESATKKLGRRALITGSVKERLRNSVDLQSAGRVVLPGKATATDLYEIQPAIDIREP